jgi:hypothetical protein
MALWQFTTIVALIGALLIHVMVLINRIGATNALLKRIEEALLKPQPITENLRAAMVRATLAASEDGIGAPARVPIEAPMPMVERRPTTESIPIAARLPTAERTTESDAREMVDLPDARAGDGRVSFLTVRDLKVIARSGRRSSDSTVGMSPLFREAMERKRTEARSLTESGQPHEEQTSDVEENIVTNAVAEEVGVASVVSHEVMEESGELHSLPVSIQEPATAAANEDAAPEAREAPLAAISETHSEAAPANFAFHHQSAAHAPIATFTANEDSTAEAIAADETSSAEAAVGATEEQPTIAQPMDKAHLERRKKRDAQFILNAQRRRRRMRGF